MHKIHSSFLVTLFVSSFLPINAVFAQSILEKVFSESFDWGPGVAGRERVSAGMPIDNMRVANSSLIWKINNGRAVFGGSAGEGKGFLELGPSGNTSLSVPVSPRESFKIEFEAEISFSEERNVRGLMVGFQSANPQNNLLINQTTDRLFLRFNANGQVVMVSAGGDFETQDRSAPVPFSNGDRVRVELERSRGAIVVNGSIHNITRNVGSNVSIPFYRAAQLSEFAINQTGHTDVKIFHLDFYQ
jgi:hypothetical protein